MTAATVNLTADPAMAADERPTPLPLRHDTFLGICEGLGSDLGFHPNWLRIALALGLFYSPVGAVLAYLGLGVIVLATRLLAPDLVIASPSEMPAQARNPELSNDTLALRDAA